MWLPFCARKGIDPYVYVDDNDRGEPTTATQLANVMAEVHLRATSNATAKGKDAQHPQLKHLAQSECSFLYGVWVRYELATAETTVTSYHRTLFLNLYVCKILYKPVLQVLVLWSLIFIWEISYKLLVGISNINYIHQGFE